MPTTPKKLSAMSVMMLQDDLGNGSQIPRGLPEPKMQSLEIQRKQNLTHWPYAAWCPHCVILRRPDTAHSQSRDGDQRSLPLLALDY